MRQYNLMILILLAGLLLVACGGGGAPEPAPAVEAPVASSTPPPIPTAIPAADNNGQAATEEPAAPAEQPASPSVQPTEEMPIGTPDTFGTSAVDALAQDYVSCVETEPHPIGEQIAKTYNVPYEEVMKLFCNGDTFDDIVTAYQTRDLTGLGVGELLDMNATSGSWDAVWKELGLLDQ